MTDYRLLISLLLTWTLNVGCWAFDVHAAIFPVTLRWAAVETDGIGYALYHGPASGVYTNRVVLMGIYATNCTVDVDGAQYFAVSALGPFGLESGLSEERLWEPPLLLHLVAERTIDGVIWTAAVTNELRASWPLEFWRVRIER